MKIRFLFSTAVLVVVSAVVLPSSSAAPILIDFGRSDNQTEGNFNNVYGTGGTTSIDTPEVRLIDSEGEETGITLTVDFSSGGSWAGTQADYTGTYPEAVSEQPETAIQDSLFIRDPANVILTLSGLDPSLSYDVLLYGARGNNGGPSSEFTFTDNSGESLIAIDVFNNATEVALFEGLVPDASSELSLLYTTTADGTRPRGALGFMQITVSGDDGPPFEITGIDFDDTVGAETNTITWSSQPDREYGVYYSTDLKNWVEVDDAVTSQGESTSFEHLLVPSFVALIDVPRLYYRITLTGS